MALAKLGSLVAFTAAGGGTAVAMPRSRPLRHCHHRIRYELRRRPLRMS